MGEINAQVEDSLLGIRVVKSFANEPMEIDKFDRGNDEFVRIRPPQIPLHGGLQHHHPLL